MSIHHSSFSAVLNLSVWFGQTIRQEYTNFGVLLKEVNESLRVFMNKIVNWFPVVVTGIKGLPLTQKNPFAFFITLCLERLLDFVLAPFDGPIR